jgi:hypothetical protein
MRRILIGACIFLVALSTTACAASFPIGAKAGLTFEPDQFAIGAFAQVSEPMLGWLIVPSVEFGFGDDITTICLQGDFIYTFPELQTTNWGWFVGGGLGLAMYSWDAPPGYDGSQSEFGLNLVGGASKELDSGNKLLGELRIGLGDIPDFKIMAGITLF